MHDLTLANTRDALIVASAALFADAARNWLDEALQHLADSDDTGADLALYSAMARRKLGEARPGQPTPISTPEAELDIERWSGAEIARVALLATAIERRPEQVESLLGDYYRMGDESERMALLRGLILFAPAACLSEIALDAGRTNSLELISAITLDNPYPARYYNDDQFNQMVLKALFLGLAIERIVGLEERGNADLARMGEQYVVEREDAGRPVPADIWLAIGAAASETGLRQMTTYLDHADTAHRYYSCIALLQCLPRDDSLRPILQERLDKEPEKLILDVLQDALET